MIILLYIILALLALLLVGYVVNGVIKLKKNSKPKVKVVKEKTKPEKKKDGLIIGTEPGLVNRISFWNPGRPLTAAAPAFSPAAVCYG